MKRIRIGDSTQTILGLIVIMICLLGMFFVFCVGMATIGGWII